MPTSSSLFVCCLLISIGYGQPSNGCGNNYTPGSTTTYNMIFDDVSRTYIVHVPEGYQSSSATSVIFGLPGYTITAQYFSNYFGMNQHSDEENYLAVYAQATSFQNQGPSIISWNDIGCSSSAGPEGCNGDGCNLPTCDGSNEYSIPSDCPQDETGCNWCNCLADDNGFINALADQIEDNYCIDITKEYVLGYSQGGMMTNRLGCSSNNRFAAIAPFAGQQPRGFNCKPNDDNPQTIGVINVWGTNDRTVPGDGTVSSDGFYYLPISDIQETFANHNGCDLNDGPMTLDTEIDGHRNWECTGYVAGCNNGASTLHGASVMQCSYMGNHNYPKDNPNSQSSPNFALPIVWQFFQGFTKNRVLRDGEKNRNYNYTQS